MKKLFHKLFYVFIFCMVLMPMKSALAQASDELCAVVQIEILQELAFERQAFEAKMKITNSLDTLSLDNVNINVVFQDDNGNLIEATSDPNNTTALFFIRVDDMTGVNDIAGSGTIAPASVAEIRWLIIPTADAAQGQPNGKLYFVGATLDYTFGGKEERVDVAPDNIVVKPQPLLTLDYFLTKEVIADDAFTPEIEPPEPYTLGVRITNNGVGQAQNVTIDSAQPTIVSNDLGLAIGFEITGSYLNNQPAEKSLLLDFGSIDPSGVKTGRWIMQSTVSGEFTAFTASFSHADELGGQLTSLLEATNTHFLIHDVMVDAPGRDKVRDYLSLDNDLVIRVYESEPLGIRLPECSDCVEANDQSSVSSLGNEQVVNGDTQLTITTVPQAGFVYIKLPDIYQGAKTLKKVIRSDGKELLEENAWLSKSRQAAGTAFDYFVNIFDENSTSAYTLVFTDTQTGPLPPVIQFIPNKTSYEGGQVGFLVQASDPNGTIPTISGSNLPVGASFQDEGNGQAVFSWFPTTGQSGQYSVTFTASDGALSASQTVQITVNPGTDKDGDGLPDAWEIEHFGDLNNDNGDDPDSDGLVNLDEYQLGADPNNPDTDGDGALDGTDDIPTFNAAWMVPINYLMDD